MTNRFKWLDQVAPGRVFEIRRKTWDDRPVRIMTLTDGNGLRRMNRSVVQVDEDGCVPDDYGGSRRARTYVGGIGGHDFPRLAVRRVPELERFDARDLDLIEYGVKLAFGGRMLDRHCGSAILPMIAGVTWTAFWTTDEDWWFRHDRSDLARVEAALKGAWHQKVRNDFPRMRRSEKGTGYLTAQEDPRKLAEIRRALRAIGIVNEDRIRVSARDEGAYYKTHIANLNRCPLVCESDHSETITKPGWSYDFITRSYSVSSPIQRAA